MRVVAGELRGRRLVAPVGDATRPTADRVREAVFNSLRSLDVVEGAVVLDLFAGSGAMGIEALSRGAEHATFVERERAALVAIKANLSTLGLADRATVVAMDALVWLASGAARRSPVDLVFADPPYGFEGWDAVLAGAAAGVFVAEAEREIVAAGWTVMRVKRYGRTHVTLLEPEGDTVAPL